MIILGLPMALACAAKQPRDFCGADSCRRDWTGKAKRLGGCRGVSRVNCLRFARRLRASVCAQDFGRREDYKPGRL